MHPIVEFILGIILIVASLIVAMIKILPKIIAKSIEQQRDYDFKKALQVDSFYRKSGNSILQELMDEWIKLATDLDYVREMKPVDLTKLIQKTVGYSSSRSIKIAAEFFQLSFVSYSKDKDGNADVDKQQIANEKGIVYFAMMVQSLKKDFTGEEIKALDVLRMKLTDYNVKKEFFKTTIAEIEKSIDSKD
ncbi:hypothetical protein [Leuconostoc suionicum]|uniref:hypothetical protein n=1 Tax=Leuconostoc suionicum TaxID=1511761 RepID=UPI001B8B2BF8|nr:hypothetical protein [Leuconostoc suionicum]MBS1008417.1 hypothetical protein [Leuconostoc suionicum]